MDVREKLVELLDEVHHKPLGKEYLERLGTIADYLITHGVTVQEWISLSEQKPNIDDLVIVFFEGTRDTPAAIQIMYGWCIGGSASHWMPLPPAPKGE